MGSFRGVVRLIGHTSFFAQFPLAKANWCSYNYIHKETNGCSHLRKKDDAEEVTMCQVNVKCPNCGTINRNLYLDETEGRFECDNCGFSGRVSAYGKPRRTICGRCGSTNFEWTSSMEEGWTLICQDCGHEMNMAPYQDVKTGRSLILPMYEREDLPRLVETARKKVTA